MHFCRTGLSILDTPSMECISVGRVTKDRIVLLFLFLFLETGVCSVGMERYKDALLA